MKLNCQLLAVTLGLAVASNYAQALEAPTLTPCTLGESGSATVSAQCGIFTVPEDYARPDGKQIDLRVALLPAKEKDALPDAITFLAGGPGQAATEAYPQMATVLQAANRQRDIVLVDQRGTGSSNRLACSFDDDDPLAAFNSDIDFAALAQECLEQLDADTRFYNTYVAMRDLEELRLAMGYSQFNLVGVSYGTRAALTFMRQYPDAVRSAIIDGVAPLQIPLGFDHAINIDRALDGLFALCAQDPVCDEAFGDVGGKLDELMERLAGEPIPMVVASPRTGTGQEIPMDQNVLRAAVRMFSYSPETASLLPLLIDDAWRSNNFARFAAQALMILEGLEDALANGMELSVLCAEDAPWYEPDTHPAEGDTLLGRILIDSVIAQCAVWPVGEIPANSKQPLVSDTPVLLLSGELDPVTPPSFAEMAAETLSNSLHLIAPGQGHNVLPRGCASKIANQFIDTASVENLEVECLESLGPAPFFTSFTGPQP